MCTIVLGAPKSAPEFSAPTFDRLLHSLGSSSYNNVVIICDIIDNVFSLKAV